MAGIREKQGKRFWRGAIWIRPWWSLSRQRVVKLKRFIEAVQTNKLGWPMALGKGQLKRRRWRKRDE
jgi:hypothetical protein